MKEETTEVKNAIKCGFYILKKILYCDMVLNGVQVNIEDKKYLCLYLGILNTDNSISKAINHKNKILSKNLTTKEILTIYNDYFTEILLNIDFNNIYNMYEYLLNNEVIRLFNQMNKIKIDKQKILKGDKNAYNRNSM